MNNMHESPAAASSAPFRFQLQRITNEHKQWHQSVEIVLVLRGSVSVVLPDRTSTLGRDDILLINRNQIHELHSSGGCELLSFRLDLQKIDLPQDEARELYFDCDSSRVPSRTRYSNLKTLIAQIVQQNPPQGAGDPYGNRSLAYSLLKELTQNFAARKPAQAREQEKYLERMDSIVSYVDSHYQEDLSLVALAEAVHLSPPYLSSLFSKYLGTTFSEYYNSVRMGHAIQELSRTDDPIDLVAVRSGYANSQAFVRAFKGIYHCLPSAYRRRHGIKDAAGPQDESGIDISGLLRYLPRASSAPPRAQPERRQTAVNASWNRISGHWQGPQRRLIGIGSAKQILLRDTQLQLEEIQRQIGFDYIKFHGMLSDEMMVVSRDNYGGLHFNFRLVDMVFDYLFSIGLKPVLQLSFMPSELALDKKKLIFSGRYNTSQPARPEKWCLLIRRLLEHLFARYGRDTIAGLPVLMWNNADSSTDMFGMQEDEAFFQLYGDTFRLIKAMEPRMLIGSPPMTFMQEESIRWAERFFLREKDRGVIPDFFCSQYYSEIGGHPDTLKINLTTQRPDHLQIDRETAGSFPLTAGLPLSTDPDHMKSHLRFLEGFKARVGLPELPVWITEWNLTVSHRQWINDTMLAGCYVVKNVLENGAGLEAMGYWSATDLIEEQPLEDEIFHGGLGLMTIEGIRKPQFLAFEALKRLRPEILAQGEGYIVTRDDDALTVLMYNYEHFNDIFAGNKTYNMTSTDRYTPFSRQEAREFSLRLSGFAQRQIIEATEFIANRRYGSAFDRWVEMGAPQGGTDPALDRYRLELLKASARPLARSINLEIRNGTLDYSAVLEPLEFRLTEIRLSR